MTQYNLSNLKQCLHTEAIGLHTPFTWGRVFRRYIRNPQCRYMIGWRVASFLYSKESKLLKKIAKKINLNLTRKHGTEIELGAQIGPGITFSHHQGIVINKCCVIGKDFHIRQNTTIGVKTHTNTNITIGDNVTLGAHCCIIGDSLTIGSNVVIGAMAFVNRNIPDNSLCYSSHELILKKLKPVNNPVLLPPY